MDGPRKARVEDEEDAARQILLPELSDHLELVERVYSLIGLVGIAYHDKKFAAIPTTTKARLVILARLADDLNCAGKLCCIGYGVQACVLAASIFEVAHTITYIGTDENRAREWEEHDDPTVPIRL